MTGKSTSVKKSIKSVGKTIRRARLSPENKDLLQRADRARKEFRYQEAVELYKKAIESGKLDPGREFEARNQSRDIYWRLGEANAETADVREMARLARLLKDPKRQTRAMIEELNTFR